MVPMSRTNVVVNLAKKVLCSAGTADAVQAPLFQELISAIASSNPTPAVPRVPPSIHDDPRYPVQDQKFHNILAKSEKQYDILAQSREEYLTESNATYGTTPAASILTLLNVLYPNGSSNASGSFVDIGSGQGIPCLAAALSGRFSIAKGIECQPKWYESAVLLKEVYDENQDAKDACTLEFHCDDATKPAGHLEGSSCVFLNSVTFDAKFCQQLGHRIESDLAREKTAGDDIFVVSLSRRLPLPSFDLVDILRLNANGEGMYTFYVNRKANTQSTFYAITDSEIMRALRDNDLVGSLVAIARGHADERLGLSLLAALAGSEPVVRQYMCCPVLLERLETSIDSKLATLTQKALGSMVLRAMSDHPVGRSAIAKSDSLLDELLAGISTDEEHPALRANFLDIFSQLLYDSPLDRISVELNETTERLQEDNAALVSDNLREALAETIAMRRWWDGHKLEISNSR